MTAPNTVGTDRALGAANATSMSKVVTFAYDANTVTQKAFIAPIPLRLVAIHGVTRVAGSGGTCTFSFYKAADGVAVGSGTLLHSGSFNLVGTADTNQYLTLATNPDSLLFNPGDSFGHVLSGTPTSAVGAYIATFEPVA